MSNSIWHKPTVRPVKDCIVVWQNPAHMSFTLPRTARKYMEKYNCERWATLDDLIAQADKAEQLQKEITQELDIYYSHNPGLHPADDCIYAIEKIIGYKRPKENQ